MNANKLDCVRLLVLKAKASLTAKCEAGKTARMYAAARKNEKVTAFLDDPKEPVEEEEEEEETAEEQKARQFAASGVTVNSVAPCYVFSPMIMEQLTAEKRSELLEKTIPVKRFCKPEEVAHAVMFLASPLSGFITGEVVDMNGGFQMD